MLDLLIKKRIDYELLIRVNGDKRLMVKYNINMWLKNDSIKWLKAYIIISSIVLQYINSKR